ncbi:unnamed protein product [Lampetra fluviatilis]
MTWARTRRGELAALSASRLPLSPLQLQRSCLDTRKPHGRLRARLSGGGLCMPHWDVSANAMHLVVRLRLGEQRGTP